jgi:dolichol kinase
VIRKVLAGGINSGILSRQKFLLLFKEFFRKSIHLCSAFIPFFLGISYVPVMISLSCVLCFYVVSEFLRLNGKQVFIISAVTEAAARKRDENKFVLGPVTLVCGILAAAFFFKPLPATIGIFALAFGDGLASLAGKLFGRIQIPGTEGKTVAGSLTCFTAIFISCWSACRFNSCCMGIDITFVALVVASIGMFIEVFPLKDFDNILIPVILAAVSQLLIFQSVY